MKPIPDKLDAVAVLCFLCHEMEKSDLPPFLCETPGKAT